MMAEDLTLKALLEFFNAAEAAIASAKRIITEKSGPEGEFPEHPYDKLIWTNGRGAKGPYQMASAKNNCNSDLYRHLESILKNNNRRFTEPNWRNHYWLGKEGDAIFRRTKNRHQ